MNPTGSKALAYSSSASNLVNDDNNNTFDIFVFDRVTENTVRVSVHSDGTEANNSSTLPSISADGRFIAFASDAINLTLKDNNGVKDVFRHDMQTGNTLPASRLTIQVGAPGGIAILQNVIGSSQSSDPSISGDGQFIAFVTNAANLHGQSTNRQQVVVKDMAATLALPELISVSTTGTGRLLASLPCAPPSNRNTVGAILADDFIGALGTTWAVFTYDTTAVVPAYVPATLSTRLEAGQGFWIKHINPVTATLDMPEGSKQVTGRYTDPATACISTDGCFELPLTGAPNNSFLWNLIGYPYTDNINVAFNDLRVSADSGSCAANAGCTMAEAADAQIVFNRFFHYNEAGYSNREAGSTLGAWEGYWVPELANAEFNSPLIRFPR